MSSPCRSGRSCACRPPQSRDADCRLSCRRPAGVGRRAADDIEHFRNRGLVFERLRQFLRPRLLGLEQARVLDGDDGLVGEGLDEGDLARREWAGARRCSANTPIACPPRRRGTESWQRKPIPFTTPCRLAGASDASTSGTCTVLASRTAVPLMLVLSTGRG